MRKPLISIIVPVYNVEQYISECIDSIVNQTYNNIQIILVDDGSTDRSGAICDKYAGQDSRIETVHQENKGVTVARKQGISLAKGKYIGFVDGDDYIEPYMYQVLLEEIEASGAEFVHSGYWEMDAERAVCEKKEIIFSGDNTDFLKDAVLGESIYITPSMWSKLYKADFIKKNFEQIPNECKYGEDLLSLIVNVLECRKIALLDAAYYHYRIRDDSLSHQNDIGQLSNIFKLYEYLCDVLLYHGCYEDLKDVIEEYIWGNLLGNMRRMTWSGFQIARYYFRDVDRLKGKRIVIYGAGMVGRDYYAQISRYTDCKVVSWADACPEKYHYPHIRIDNPKILQEIEYDIAIVAVKSEKMSHQIAGQLSLRGVEKEKIYWSEPGFYCLGKKENV